MLAYPREKVSQAFEMKDAGISRNQMCKELGLTKGTLRRWFSDPHMDPYLDEVAIKRAVDGDVKVYDALTYFEREEVLSILLKQTGDIDFNWRFGSAGPRILHAVHKVQGREEARARRAVRPMATTFPVKKRTAEFDAKIVQLHGDGMTYREIAKALGASATTVGRVLKSAA